MSGEWGEATEVEKKSFGKTRSPGVRAPATATSIAPGRAVPSQLCDFGLPGLMTRRLNCPAPTEIAWNRRQTIQVAQEFEVANISLVLFPPLGIPLGGRDPESGTLRKRKDRRARVPGNYPILGRPVIQRSGDGELGIADDVAAQTPNVGGVPHLRPRSFCRACATRLVCREPGSGR